MLGAGRGRGFLHVSGGRGLKGASGAGRGRRRPVSAGPGPARPGPRLLLTAGQAGPYRGARGGGSGPGSAGVALVRGSSASGRQLGRRSSPYGRWGAVRTLGAAWFGAEFRSFWASDVGKTSGGRLWLPRSAPAGGLRRFIYVPARLYEGFLPCFGPGTLISGCISNELGGGGVGG